MLKQSLALIGLTLSLSANAAIVKLNDAGELVGADNVEVRGKQYNVSFIDGTCLELFNGCDQDSDFVFGGDKDAASDASQALLDQVFFDSLHGNFSSNSSLTNGCEDNNVCYVMTVAVTYSGVNLAYDATNHDAKFPVPDRVSYSNSGINFDSTSDRQRVYAVWRDVAQVPIPSSVWLLVLALLSFIGVERLKKV
jgi:hypothetical protein